MPREKQPKLWETLYKSKKLKDQMKRKFALDIALERAASIKNLLAPHAEKISIAGSIRRRQEEVGDIEILYVPKIHEEVPQGELVPKTVDKSEEQILKLISTNVLSLRKKSNGTTSFGKRIKLLLDTESKIPIDLFSCHANQWVNNLVSRTGGKLTNITIASYAKRIGWNWRMFDAGFVNKRTSEAFIPKTEEELFKFAKVPYMPPWDRP
jgi:DNA polymerase/3'-5' exonuclease PolX